MTYAHDAHCNTIHEAGPEPCPPARELDAATVRPGDTLIVRVEAQGLSRQQFEEFSSHLRGRLPGVEVMVIAAEQMLVYRPEG